MKILIHIVLFIILFALIRIDLNAQNDSITFSAKQSNFLVNLNLGLSTSISDSINTSIDRTNLSATLRLLWQPGYNLNLGIEAGWLHVSHLKRTEIKTQFGKTEARAVLAVTPILFIINKKIWGFDFYAGVGAGHFWSEVEAFGEISNSDDWDYCYMFALAYYWQISKSFSLGIESKYLTVSQLEKTVGGIHIGMNYTMLTW